MAVIRSSASDVVSVTRAATVERVATRIDPVSGVREEAAFVGAGEEELFCVVYHPVSIPRGGIVICCSLLAEQLKLYRTEVLAARAFASRGFAVIRYHYRGMGHSGGVTESTTLASMLDDTVRAAEFLAERTGGHSVTFCGARWGGLLAGLAASRSSDSSLVMWEPVVDGERYFREALRAGQMSAVVRGGGTMMTMGQILAEMEATGYVDTLGYPIHLGLYRSAVRRGLIEVASALPRPVLLIQVSKQERLKPDLAALVDSFTRSGSRVETALVRREEAWSFVGSPVQSTDALIQTTLAWLGGETSRHE